MTSFMENNEPIYDLASQCENLFDQGASHATLVASTTIKLWQECHDRFLAWTSYLGVFAKPSLCLDRRLENHPELLDLVLRLLDILRNNLLQAIPDDDVPAPDTISINEDGLLRVTDVAAPLVQQLKAIEGSIDRLNRLGVAIRRSSVVSHVSRTRGLMETSKYTLFKELAHIAIKSIYPDTNDILQDQLSTSMAERYAKILSRQSHQTKLQTRRQLHQVNLQSIIEEDSKMQGDDDVYNIATPPLQNRKAKTIQIKNRSNQVKSTLSSELPSSVNTHLVNKRMQESQEGKSRLRMASSVQVNRVNYPKPNNNTKGGNYITCEWCFESYDTSTFTGDHWKHHVDKDLEPYICLYQGCHSPIPSFATFQEWQSHMLFNHGLNWHQKIHWPLSWVCAFCPGMAAMFQSQKDVYDHIRGSHALNISDIELESIVGQGRIQIRQPHGECPMCCRRIEYQKSAPPSIPTTDQHKLSTDRRDVAKRHQEPIATSSPKRVKVNFLASSDIQSSVKSKSNLLQESDVIIEPSNSPNTDRNPMAMETIARHIASHLQSLSFLTTRLFSVFDHEGVDTVSHTSSYDPTVSTSSNLDFPNAPNPSQEGESVSIIMDNNSDLESGGMGDELGLVVHWDQALTREQFQALEDDPILQHITNAQQHNTERVVSTKIASSSGSPKPNFLPPRNRKQISFSTPISPNYTGPDTPTLFSITRDIGPYRYTRKLGIIMVIIADESQDTALPWVIQNLAAQGNTVVCLYRDALSQNITLTRNAASALIDRIEIMNVRNINLSIVVEWAPSEPFMAVLQNMIELHSPSIIIYSLNKRDSKGMLRFKLPGSQDQVWPRHSPVPVVGVTSEDAREKSKKRRINDPGRQTYANIIAQNPMGKHEADYDTYDSYPLKTVLRPDEEAYEVRRALGLSSKFGCIV